MSDEKTRAEFVAAVEGHPKFADWEAKKKERQGFEDKELELSKEYATYRRFVRVFENVAYAANLEKVAKEEVKDYRRVLAAEREGF